MFHQNNFSLQSSFTHTAKAVIWQRIKFFRKQNNLTQEQLGDLIGADKQYVWSLENGRKNIRLDSLDKIIEKLKCTPEDFFIM